MRSLRARGVDAASSGPTAGSGSQRPGVRSELNRMKARLDETPSCVLLEALMEDKERWTATFSRHRRRANEFGQEQEDVFQEATLTAWRARFRLTGQGELDAWFSGVLRNTILKLLRDSQRLKRCPLGRRCLALRGHSHHRDDETFEPTAEIPGPHDLSVLHERCGLIELALRHLPRPYRAVIRRFHFEGMTIRAIAMAIGRSQKAVEMLLLRGRAALKKELAVHGVDA